jgi:F0F1-type ATP synthase alpha subunit
MHFGSEVGENLRRILKLGEKLDAFFSQPTDRVIPVNINIVITAAMWIGFWSDIDSQDARLQMDKLISAYEINNDFKKDVDIMISSSSSFSGLLDKLREQDSLIRSLL